MKRLWVCMILSACGGDAETNLDQPCSLSIAGDATGADSCRIFLCYPVDSGYDSLSISSTQMPTLDYNLIVEVAHPTRFTDGGTYSLDDLEANTWLQVNAGGKTYVARPTVMNGSRHPDESASLVVTKVHAPSSDDVCGGWIEGTFTASLVEYNATTVGAGRLTVQAALAQ